MHWRDDHSRLRTLWEVESQGGVGEWGTQGREGGRLLSLVWLTQRILALWPPCEYLLVLTGLMMNGA
jgi:hypothetical protein